MKQLLLLALFAPFIAHSQISINSADMPVAGTTYHRENGELTDGFDFSQTGADFYWDFSTMTSAEVIDVDYISISDAPFTYQFLFNNPFDQAHLASHAVQTEGFSTAQVTFDNFYAFYKNSEDDYRAVGYGATVNSFPVPSQTNPIDVLFTFPLEYNNSGTSYSEWAIEIPTLGSYLQKLNRSYVVDGYGTLSLPEYTGEVIRVRSELSYQDSIYIDALGFGFNIPREIVQYQWFANGEGMPVLDVSTTLDLPTAISYKTSTENIGSIQVKESLFAYPTLCSDMVMVGSSLNTLVSGRLYASNGQLVHTFNGVNSIDVSMFVNGLYFLELTGSVGSETKKIVIQH